MEIDTLVLAHLEMFENIELVEKCLPQHRHGVHQWRIQRGFT